MTVSVYNGNAPYLAVDGVSLGTSFQEVSPEFKNNEQEVSAGTGITHKQFQAGLNETTFKLTLGYLVGSVSQQLPLLRQGTIHTFEYGSEGNTTGKPRHVQQVLVNSVGHAVKVAKDKVAFAVSFTGIDAPTVDMHAGGVY
jgi:hypothetical protein